MTYEVGCTWYVAPTRSRLRHLDGRLSTAIRWAAVAAKKREDITGTLAQQLLVATGSYNLVNLYVSYQIDPTLQLGFSVENLLNEQYKIYTHEFASPGDTAKLSLRTMFAPGPDLTAHNNPNTASLRPPATR